MEHCYSSTTIYFENGRTTWCKAQNNQIHSESKPSSDSPKDTKHLSLPFPFQSMSSDGLYSSNANLVLKGIMGLHAMGEINKILEARGANASNTSYYLVSFTVLLLYFPPDWTTTLGYGQCLRTRMVTPGRFFRPRCGELWIEFDMGDDIQSFRSQVAWCTIHSRKGDIDIRIVSCRDSSHLRQLDLRTPSVMVYQSQCEWWVLPL